MKLKSFKKIVGDSLTANDFSKKGRYYYLSVQDITIIVGLQKSNYSNGYYINIGYVISRLNPDLSTPRDIDGDVRARVGCKEGKNVDFFDLEHLHDDA